MPDLGPLTDAQRDALRDLDLQLTMYRDAVSRRIEAERAEAEQRYKLQNLAYEIAGVA